MAQYERFLSYFFEYDQDKKGDNCGFAKIEVRGDTKRIQIVMKVRVPAEALQVCGFYREGNRCRHVLLGRMSVGGGTGQFQYMSAGPWLRGSQIPFERLKGLVIGSAKRPGRAYATVWDDEPFGLSLFEMAEDKAETELKQQPGLESGTRAGLKQQPGLGTESGPEMRPGTESGSGRRPEVKLDPESEPVSPEFSPANEETYITSTTVAGHREEKEYVEGRRENRREEHAGERRGEYAETRGENRMPPPDSPAADNAAASDWSAGQADVFWAGLCRRFPGIEELSEDSRSCLRAVPADIGRLPRPNWIFGSNGFLVYSYVRYRYIVFARVARKEFELWVPGVYGRNEEMMAEMFGFFRFRSAKAAQPSPGDFGYWCVPLTVPGVMPAKKGEQNDRTGTAQAAGNVFREGAFEGADMSGTAKNR